MISVHNRRLVARAEWLGIFLEALLIYDDAGFETWVRRRRDDGQPMMEFPLTKVVAATKCRRAQGALRPSQMKRLKMVESHFLILVEGRMRAGRLEPQNLKLIGKRKKKIRSAK